MNKQPSCDCSKPKIDYNEKYDAHYCIPCNKWLDKRCIMGKYCFYCVKRPEFPLQKV